MKKYLRRIVAVLLVVIMTMSGNVMSTFASTSTPTSVNIQFMTHNTVEVHLFLDNATSPTRMGTVVGDTFTVGQTLGSRISNIGLSDGANFVGWKLCRPETGTDDDGNPITRWTPVDNTIYDVSTIKALTVTANMDGYAFVAQWNDTTTPPSQSGINISFQTMRDDVTIDITCTNASPITGNPYARMLFQDNETVGNQISDITLVGDTTDFLGWELCHLVPTTNPDGTPMYDSNGNQMSAWVAVDGNGQPPYLDVAGVKNVTITNNMQNYAFIAQWDVPDDFRPVVPEVGFYTYDVNSADYVLITNDLFTVTSTDKVFYLKADAGWELLDIILADGLGNIANAEVLQNSTNIVKITVTGTPDANNVRYYDIFFSASHPSHGTANMGLGIQLTSSICKHISTTIIGSESPTCTKDGFTGNIVCDACGATLNKGTTIAKLGHDSEVVGAKNATCTANGYTGDTVCKTCNAVVEKGAAVKALGHTYTGNVCTVCNLVIVTSQKVEISNKVELVTPVVKQETLDKALNEAMQVVNAIISNDVSDAVKSAVSEETMNAIKKAVESGAQIKTEVVSNVITEDQVKKEDVAEIKAVLGTEATVAQYLDLSVMIKAVAGNNTASNLGTLNELSEPITFVIAIPENLEKVGREFYILRVHEGQVDKLEVTKNMDGSYSFETDRFSTYALVYEDNATPTNESPKTGDITMWIFAAFALVGFCGILVSSKKRFVKY